MILRFVQGSELSSKMIIALEKTCVPFTPSHVECVTPDGFYLGSLYDGGVKERNPGYDAGKINHELFLTLPATLEQDKIFYDYMHGHIGELYDWKAIPGFLLPGHWHSMNHTICSAIIDMGLRTCKWFPFVLPVPAHETDPRDLLLMIGVGMQIPM